MENLMNLLNWVYDILPEAFLELVNISITAGWIVLAVVLVRLLFRKAPKWLNCALWGIVALRLVFPFDIQSALSLIPSTQTLDPKTVYSNQFEINTGFEAVDSTVNNYMGGNYYEGVTVPDGFKLNITQILGIIWLAGMLLMLIYAFASWAKLKLNLRMATKKEGNIYQSEFVQSPFVLGLIKPKIYLPYQVNEADIPLVIAHEKAHIKRLDYLIKPFGFLLLSVHWFNPLLWVAYVLLCRDIEAACDEKVIKDLGEDERKSYSVALLNASISRKSIAACPLAFGEVGVKERIKGVMNYKKPAFWVVIAAIAVLIVAAVCFLTSPRDDSKFSYHVTMDEQLEAAVENAILENNNQYFDGEFACQANEVIASESSGSKKDEIHTITVYTMAMYQKYGLEDNVIVETGGNIEPVAITFRIGEDDNYTLLEYWEPEMGRDYVSSIKSKFPAGVDTDTQNYVSRLQTECEQKARDYFRAEFATKDTTEEYSTTAVIATNEDKTNTNEIPTNSPGGINQPVDDYLLHIVESKSEGVTWITNEAFGKKYGYHVYLYCLDECYVYIGGKEYPLGEALNSGKVTADAIVSKAAADAQNGKAVSQLYKDGGSTVISYDDGGSTEYKTGGYAVIKKNSLEGDKNVFIGPADMTLNQVNKFMEGVSVPDDYTTPNSTKPTEKPTDINGVTADISLDAEPNLSGKIKEVSNNLILMEVTYAQDGIKEGTPVYVRLDTVLSYAPDIDSLNLKKGDNILVVYDGRIMETYPLQIDAYAVYKAVT